MATAPKKQGGPTGKPAPKYDKNGKRIFSGTGKTAKPMPDLRKTGGVGGPAVKPKAGTKAGPSVASKVAKRVGTVAREGRDLVTAASSTAKAGLDAARTGKAFALKKNLQDLPKQVKEVGAAAVKGKIGTPALETNTGKKSYMKDRATVTEKPRSRKNYKG